VIVRPGQTIRLTLYDFAVARQRRAADVGAPAASDGGSSSRTCPAYAVLREPGSSAKSPRAGRNVTVCGGVARRSVVYMSISNKVDVGLERADHVVYGAHYLIEYQGSSNTIRRITRDVACNAVCVSVCVGYTVSSSKS